LPRRRIGQHIREKRIKLNISQSELATRLGVSQGLISRIEHGEHPLTVDLLYAISRELHTPISELVKELDITLEQFGKSTLQQIENLFVTRQYRHMLTLIRRSSGAEYFRAVPNQVALNIWKAAAYFGLKQYDTSMKICQDILTQYKHIHDDLHISALHAIIGMNHYFFGNYEEAHRELCFALRKVPTERQTTIHLIRNLIYYHLGMVYFRMGNLNDAIKYLKQASNQLSQEAQINIREQANVLLALCQVELQNGQTHQALDHANEALRNFEFIRDITGQIDALIKIGLIYQTQHDDTANRYFDQAYKLITDNPRLSPPESIQTLRNMGYDV
jgi:transcriptional regulator with XRE-family HTH domain